MVKLMKDLIRIKLKEFKHLNWDQIREENTLSFRESACLHRLHEELYGATS